MKRPHTKEHTLAIQALPHTPLRKFMSDAESRSVDEQGNARRFINVFLKEKDARFLEQMETEVENGDELSIIPAIAGGH